MSNHLDHFVLFFPCIVFPGKLWHQSMEHTLALSLARTCPELSMTTSCAGHFPYFRCPALRNNHRSEQACARCPPAMSQNSCAHPPPPTTHTIRACGWHTRQKWSVLLQGASFFIGVMLSIFASIKGLLIPLLLKTVPFLPTFLLNFVSPFSSF